MPLTNPRPAYKVSPEERALRMIVCNTIAEYETEYRFHNDGGHFVERLLRHMGEGRGIGASLYLTLIGCSERGSSLSIPCAVRKEIEERIVSQIA